MKLMRIFDGENPASPDGLYSIQYDHKDCSEYHFIMQSWRKPELLFSFFDHHITDLENGFWGDISIDEAVANTVSDAKRFEETLFTYCRSPQLELQYIFQPLYNHEYRLISLQKSKGKIRRSWLRLYALRIDRNCFVITGGAIKLTGHMQRIHLQEELQKLEQTKRFLQSNDIQISEDLNLLQ